MGLAISLPTPLIPCFKPGPICKRKLHKSGTANSNYLKVMITSQPNPTDQTHVYYGR